MEKSTENAPENTPKKSAAAIVVDTAATAVTNPLRLIEVVPFTRGIALEKLTYFTAEDVVRGSVVLVPVRKKIVTAIVTDVQDAARARSQIRTAGFEVKKVANLQARQFFLPEFIEACSKTALYSAASTGSVLYSMTSKHILDHIDTIMPDVLAISPQNPSDNTSSIEKYALQAPDEERYGNYKSFIREQFARKSSVFFCLPNANDIQSAVPKLVKGIEDYTFVLHSEMPEKELIEQCRKMLAVAHPVLIIATGTFLSLPRRDIGAIILEKENSRGYKLLNRPFLDIRIFAEFLARKMGAKLVIGDLFLQTETIYRYKNGEFHELYPLKFRSIATSESILVDMRPQQENSENRANETAAGKKPFTAISDQLAALISDNDTENEHLFIFCARKGLSPTVVCSDCGTIVTCNTCGNPVVLHGTIPTNPSLSQARNFFLCHHCGERRSAAELCNNCQGWRLTTLGIGTELVAQKIKELFPEQKFFIVDKEQVKTSRRARSLIKEFYESPGSVLVGTEMALNYLDQPMENCAVAGIDSFFSIPDFRINEKVLSILLKMRSLSQKRFLLQTRNPDQQVFAHALRGNIMDFYRDELALRKSFLYPPYSVLIKISLEGKREVIAEEMARVKTLFETNIQSGEFAHEFDIFPSFIKGHRGASILHALLKVPAEEWPDDHLLAKLRSLPPQFTIKVDPDSLL